MRQLEAFSLGKKFGHPETNEDSLVVMPNLGYAVIDGVTDRNGTRYGGMLSGQFASRTVKRAIEIFLLAQGQKDQPQLQFQGGEHFVDYLGKAIHAGYAAHGALAAVEADWKLRGGCTVMAAMLIGDRLEIVAVGDSGIRVNGKDTLQVLKPLDDVTAILRRETWRYFEALGKPTDECDRLAGSMTWQGTRNQPHDSVTANGDVVAAIEARALSASREHLPGVPESELLLLIQHGISHGQGKFQNVTEPVLGYGGIDGFAVPGRFVETRSYPLADIHTIELFSDGYFKPGTGFGVASWEAAFQDVEAEDFHKIGRYMSTKGTTSTQLTDDRSYLGVRLK
ncbi:hypothetical protein ASD04_16210 [Devosia sp. Root436]|uniref:hypothetical protein n=1 Tax=Devosia sp. Root436 TaxID=1736537 RepID=UPI0006F6AFAC|nr:hypothetical protein [Devosia sp. Root436]KQX34923.1 hypothetical protein ASD04_16210 [Devosia sp. Root436]